MPSDLPNATSFADALLAWAAAHPREMPWKNEKNPYLIWLSEIILQQTRVEQGLPYFLRFREKYPTIVLLAAAPPDEVMKLWEGLGYYSRARNLHATAQYVSEYLGGIFPTDFEQIRALKGVGDYTAAAVASFAFDLPHAVVDGNVYRVLARIFGIETPIDSSAGKKQFADLAQQLLDKAPPARYNQAIMDFGATHCTPAAPRCAGCPFAEQCRAFLEKKIAQLPVKSKKLVRRERFFNFFLIYKENKIWIQRREQKDIWQGLYQFPLIETENLVSRLEMVKNKIFNTFFDKKKYIILRHSAPMRHQLTHQTIIAVFWEIEATDALALPESFVCVARKNLSDFAFPRLIDQYLEQKEQKTLLLDLD